jgi:hypothetical protein
MSTLDVAPNSKSAQAQHFFCPIQASLGTERSSNGDKKKAKLGLGSELGPKPKLSLFSFCSIQASLGADRS